MHPPRNASTAQLLGILIERTEGFGRELGDIKKSIARLTDKHDARISVLEDDATAVKGGRRMLFLIGGTLGTVTTLIGGFVGKMWWQ